MKIQFANHHAVSIDPGSPNAIFSEIEVLGVDGKITDVNVTVDVDHSFTADLHMTLISPDGTRVKLVGDAGSSGDDFRSTVFDDQAEVDVRDATPPFTGSFRPEQSLEAFQRQNPHGTWTLEIRDDAFADGGELHRWFLDIETEGDDVDQLVFRSTDPVQIRSDSPDVLVSAIHVTGHAQRLVARARVAVEMEHSFTQDLTLTLIGPLGDRAILADRVGGGGDHFDRTTFADDADTKIRKAEPPFRGRFRPEEPLELFSGKPVAGAWRLEVRDHESGDGGSLKAWAIHLDAPAEREVPPSEFHIDVEFLGGLTATQQAVFEDAAARWSEVIIGDLPEEKVGDTVIDDVLIGAQGQVIDGAGGPDGNVLGQAGPTHLRPGSLLPVAGVMTFDTHDLGEMEADGSLLDVIVHEMGHVLGIGTLWSYHGLIEDPVDGFGPDNPTFTGQAAVAEYAAFRASDDARPVPVENQGGPGTRNGHWRESVFKNELMTGWINQGVTNPLSRITVASLADLGYEVNLESADPFGLLALMESRAVSGRRRECCTLEQKIDDRRLVARLTANAVIEEAKVGDKVSWNLKLGSRNGPVVGETGSADMQGLFHASAELPKNMANPIVLNLQLDDVTALDVVLVSSTVYDGKVEVKGDGDTVKLTGPLLLFGNGIELFCNSLDQLTLQNKSDQDAKVQILIGRTLTA